MIEENKKDSNKLWSILNKLIGKTNNKRDISDEIMLNGIKETNKEEICNAFAKHNSEVGEKFAKIIEEKGNLTNPLANMRNRIEQNFLFSNYYN